MQEVEADNISMAESEPSSSRLEEKYSIQFTGEAQDLVFKSAETLSLGWKD